MASSLTIEGKEYISATLASKHFDYTKDYLLLLIKQGKIDGKKIANRWYVYLPSAQQFFEDAKKYHTERKEKIRNERKIELRGHVSVAKRSHRHTALVETFAIVIIGLALGSTGYLSSSSNVSVVQEGNQGFFEQIAISLYKFFAQGDEGIQGESVIQTNVPHTQGALLAEQKVISASSTVNESLVVIPENGFDVSQIETIKKSFSDQVEVTVDPENPETGVIVPKFKEHTGEAYRFLLVPVKLNKD